MDRAMGIDLRWPSADEQLRLIAMIQGDREDFEARSARVHALAGRPAPPPIDRAHPRRLDDPDHGGLPPDVAQRLLAQQARIRAEIEDPPPDTGTLVRVAFPPARLAGTLTLIRAAAADSGVDAADRGIGRAPASSTSRSPPRRRRRRWPGSSPRCGRNWAA